MHHLHYSHRASVTFEIGEGKVVPLDNTIKEKFSLVVDEKYLKVLEDFLEKRAISFELTL